MSVTCRSLTRLTKQNHRVDSESHLVKRPAQERLSPCVFYKRDAECVMEAALLHVKKRFLFPKEEGERTQKTHKRFFSVGKKKKNQMI